MSEQVMISREACVIALRLIHRELETLANGSAIERFKTAKEEFAALLQSPTPAQPGSAQPAGEVPEVVGWRHSGDKTRLLCDLGKQRSIPGTIADEFTEPLMAVAQHTRIVAALQARAVVMPERENRKPSSHDAMTRQEGWNDCLDEVARLNGKGGV